MTEALDTPVREVMTRPLRTVESDLTAQRAAEIMVSEGIGSVVVAEPRGVVTKTDLVRGVQEGRDLERTPVSELMSRPLLTVDPTDDVQDVVNRMEDHGVKRLIVTSGSELVGIVTATDLAAALAVDLDAVIGLFADTSSADRPHTYECVECGTRGRSDSHPTACPDCGGRIRNISVPRE
jgi:signal-transduction protein with cAMP-binding, CBS, and nucleotidyltransferase domain